MVFTQFLCFLHVFSNHVCQVHQVTDLLPSPPFPSALTFCQDGSISALSPRSSIPFAFCCQVFLILENSRSGYFIFVSACLNSTHFVFDHPQCLGPSMLPTFNVAGDILLLEHLSVAFDKIRPGDVVMARSPVNPRVMVCKRVLGLEGDRVTVLPTTSRGQIRHVMVSTREPRAVVQRLFHSFQCECNARRL